MATLPKTDLSLLSDYLDVCNAAAEVHRHSLVYNPIIAAYESVFANRLVGLDIYESDPDEIETTVPIRLVDGRFEPVPESGIPESNIEPSFHLKLKRSYMEDVIAHRQEYIQHPEKLDWDWIKSRFGKEPNHDPATGANMRPPEVERYEAPAKGANMRPHSARADE